VFGPTLEDGIEHCLTRKFIIVWLVTEE